MQTFNINKTFRFTQNQTENQCKECTTGEMPFSRCKMVGCSVLSALKVQQGASVQPDT